MMKKSTWMFGLLIIMLTMITDLMAQDSFSGARNLTANLIPVSSGTFKELPGEALETLSRTTDGIVTMEDITGDYVFSYLTSLSGMVDGMNGITVKAITGNTIILENFWREGNVEATVDLAAGTITIPSQKFGRHPTFGDFDIRSYTADGTTVISSKTEPIVGTISKNGIVLTSAWGVFITGGENADKFFNLYAASLFEKSNARMTGTLKDNSTKANPVIVTQLPGDTLQIKNFADWGQTVNVDLHENGSVSILPQPVYVTTDAAGKKVELYCYKVDYETSIYSKTEPIRGTGSARSFTWDNWFIATPDAKLVLDKYLSTTVTLDFDIRYPKFPFEGAGTEENPFLLKTKDDLIALSVNTSEKNKDCAGMYFKLNNDIDLNLDERFTGISYDNNRKNSFAGVFDGDGHSVHRMKMNNVGWNGDNIVIAKCKSDVGFIANLAVAGVVKNLTIAADCDILFWAGSGAIVGYNSGTVENCKNYANVNGISCWIGGIAGTNLGVIEDCYNTGIIKTGYNMVGGIAGQSKGGIIKNCQNDGIISAEVLSAFETSPAKIFAAGGIAGYSNGVIMNVVNTGTVKSPFRAGGIVAMCSPLGGTYQDVSNAVNYGTILTDNKHESGGIVGVAEKTGRYQNAFSDGQIVPYGGINNKDEEGCRAVKTDFLLTGIESLDASVWTMQPGSYPVLSKFSKEPSAIAASKMIIRLGENERVNDVKTSVTLSAGDGLSWTLKDATSFSITESTLHISSSSAVTKDTLTGTWGDYTKILPLMSVAGLTLQGEGTQTSPYLISAPEDWNTFAGYIKDSGRDFEGTFFRVTVDLDFTEKDFQPIAIDDAVFQGYFDGNGKKILNLNYNAGTTAETAYRALFGTVGPKGTIANLTFESGSITGYSYIGGFVSDLYGSIVNCVNKATVTTNGGPTVAGIAVYARGGASIIRDCINYGTISTAQGKGYAAGILNSSDPGTVVENCANEGTVTAYGNYAGGIVCYGYGPSVLNCRNKGEVISTGKYAGGIVAGLDAAVSLIKDSYNQGAVSAKNNAGGILAQAFKPFASESRIENCYNEGTIKTSDNYVAGIAGYINKNLLVTGCYNTGEVRTEKAYAGGIIGQVATLSASQPAKVYNCYNSGEVSAATMNAGGIAADVMDYMAIDSCYNLGDISAKKTAGGISSNIKSVNNAITDCWNAGNITVGESVAGGILGSGIFAAPISGCFNVGTVKSTGEDAKTSYSIGGLAGATKAVFTNCYNMGKVEGYKLIAGLVGSPAAGTLNASSGKITYGTSFTKCYNMGEVILKDTLGGNIVGNVVNYLFFDNIYAVDRMFESDSIATLLTEAGFAKLDMGEGWIYADYAYPLLASHADNNYATFYAAVIELAEGDTINNVTKDFHVGTPGHVVWKATTDNLQVSGNDVSVKAGAVGEEARLVAEAGELSKEIILTLNTLPDGIGKTTSARSILNTTYYTVEGIRVVEPVKNTIYITVKTYDNGTTEIIKSIGK